MRNKMKLGRKIYKVFTQGTSSVGEDGLWIDNPVTERNIRANIQGGLFWNSVKFSDSGDIGKKAISIRSDEELIMSNGTRRGDLVFYRDCYWEVRDCREYTNLPRTRHWEAMAVLVDGDVLVREDLP